MRALRILKVIADAFGPLALVEVSRRVALHASTTYRLLATLVAHGFVEQDSASGQYRIGVEAFRVGHSFANLLDLRARVRPMLEALAGQSNETANLVVPSALEAVYIDHVTSKSVARLLTQVGQRVPLHCTAVGKVLLAGMAVQNRIHLPQRIRLTYFTPKTITTRVSLGREIAKVRAQGYAVDRQEHEIGVACVAAPVRGVFGDVVAAIGISGPSGRVLAALSTLIVQVQQSAADASRALGAATATRRAVRSATAPQI